VILRVLALTRYDRLGSSSRVRFYQYFPYLKAQGVNIVNEPFFSNDYVRDIYEGRRPSLKAVVWAYLKRIAILAQIGSFDLLWMEKELLPLFPAGLEALFQIFNIPYVVDYDDAVFHRYDMHSLALVRALLGHKIDAVMRQAALVIVGNEYLAERARRAGARKVEFLPSVVDVKQYVFRQRKPSSVFEIGWIGSPITAPYLDLIRDAVNALNHEANIHITLIGAGDTNPFLGVPTTVMPWSEESELSIGQKFDVGVMPLADGPFERGKCGYKLVQYMAGGIPVIASPVGVNQQIVEPDINGYLANSTDDWLIALRRLRNNVSKRREMGEAGRKKVEQKYNLRVTAPRLLELLSSIAKA
jgi:glycosyltransferase involved in cell wall biosynthesis